jgi:4-hydroxybenzoate polyprenyltransferase
VKRTPFGTALALGRVSNLPTVWTNVMAGLALSGVPLGAPLGLPLGNPLGRPDPWLAVVALSLALSSFYVGGMFLNDAFDRRWDREHRPDRPIPAGDASAAAVFIAGFGLLGGGLILLALATMRPEPVLGGLALAALIVLYDVAHKGNPLAPVLMASCRAMIYVIAGLAAGGLRPLLAAGVAALAGHVALVSIVARKEAGDPRLPARVAFLIAAICLLDAVLLALTRSWAGAAAAVACFFLTRAGQRRIAGT